MTKDTDNGRMVHIEVIPAIKIGRSIGPDFDKRQYHLQDVSPLITNGIYHGNQP